jgi:hypothetical protein
MHTQVSMTLTSAAFTDTAQPESFETHTWIKWKSSAKGRLMLVGSQEVRELFNFVRHNMVTHTAFHIQIPQMPKALWNTMDHMDSLRDCYTNIN